MLPPLPIGQSTLLRIGGPVPLYSARGLKQTLEPIAASEMLRRTVNGKLVGVSAPQFSLYKTRITGADQEPPWLSGVWPGQRFTIECIAELAFAPSQGAPGRPAVPGSIRAGPDGFTFFRPIIIVLITAFSVDSDEWGAQVGWTIDGEEEKP